RGRARHPASPPQGSRVTSHKVKSRLLSATHNSRLTTRDSRLATRDSSEGGLKQVSVLLGELQVLVAPLFARLNLCGFHPFVERADHHRPGWGRRQRTVPCGLVVRATSPFLNARRRARRRVVAARRP